MTPYSELLNAPESDLFAAIRERDAEIARQAERWDKLENILNESVKLLGYARRDLRAVTAERDALRAFAQEVDEFIWNREKCDGVTMSRLVGIEERHGIQVTVNHKFQPTPLLTGQPAREPA